MLRIPTQFGFLSEMGAPNLDYSLFKPDMPFSSWPEVTVLTWPEFLNCAKKSPLFAGHRLELVWREQNYEVNSRSVGSKQLYEFRVQVACWDSAWLRTLASLECARTLSEVVVSSFHAFARLSGWTVFGSQFCSVGLVDLVRIFAAPLVSIPDLPNTGRAGMGRARVLNGLSLQLPTKSAAAAFPPTALAVLRLRACGFHHGLSPSTLAAARENLIAAKTKLSSKQREHHVLANWVAEMTGRSVIPRLVRVPISLLLHVILDTKFGLKRKNILNAAQLSGFVARVQQVRESFGDRLLVEETPPRDRVAAKVIILE